MTYRWCEPCDTCHFAGSCYDEFEVWCEDDGIREEARIIRAYDAESAATRWGSMYDSEGDYTIVSGSEATVHVCLRGTDVIEKFLVTGESVPEYSARSLGTVTIETESNP